jgi:hypothetical protein
VAVTEREPEHEEVVSSLLDLQRRLRGGDDDVPEPPSNDSQGASAVRRVEEASAPAPDPSDEVEVAESDLSVLMTPASEIPETAPAARDRFAPVTQLPTATATATAGDDRMAALAQRLSRLEQDLSGVLDSIDTIRGDVTEDLAARMTAMQAENDARTTRIVAEHMDAVSDRLSGELGVQRRDLAGVLEQRIRDMEATLRDAIRTAADIATGRDRPKPKS